MITKRIFIFRINGVDNFITDNATDAVIIYESLERDQGIGYKWDHTELNNMTTTYYFVIKDK